jgi:tRNA 2-selenouridine synthase
LAAYRTMALIRIAATDALLQLSSFDCVIDARSESEFALDRLPGAVNWPTLNDAQRHAVGTQYKQVSAFEARKSGAALAAANIAQHVATHVQPLPPSWQPLVYCWRGGQRSGALATVLSAIGFRVAVLEGGYREFRRSMVADFEALPQRFEFRVLCGRTGSAKSHLLHALRAQGAQVLDLEALAKHRGSVLGPEPGQPQPSQKAFETTLWWALRELSPERVVFVESESATIGRLRVPEPLLLQMRASACVQVQLPLQERVQFLLRDYAHFVQDVASFNERLNALRDLRGAAVVQGWQAQALQGQLPAVVQALLTEHYDPVYLKSMSRNYAGFEAAPTLALADAQDRSLHAAAASLLAMSTRA